ncbi:MAG TPA: tetratricopeptide repeat protein, partial [Spirochaetia bacterium]|nr:tetratricopeptide repeat protein [Spirochaetia bacterium]
SDSLQIAMQIYHGLAALDILYQEDPTSPFTQVQENEFMVDSISLPRTTLTRATGDCDDLTVLYASLLETLGIETGFMTTPGHIYVAFNTRVSSRDYQMLHPEREMFLDVDGEAWIPVEVTLIGREDFTRAWRTGMELWRRAGSEPDTRGFYLTAEAQSAYRPVGLREQDLGLQYGDESVIRSAFVADRDRLVSTIITPLRERAEEDRTVRAYNNYGIAAATLGLYGEAARAFRDASLRDRDLLSPRINLGSVSYLRGDYQSALDAYSEAERILRARGRDTRSSSLAKVLINISQTHYAMKNYEQAEIYYAQASEEGPEVVEDYSHLANVASEQATGRASQIDSGSGILFLDQDTDQ